MKFINSRIKMLYILLIIWIVAIAVWITYGATEGFIFPSVVFILLAIFAFISDIFEIFSLKEVQKIEDGRMKDLVSFGNYLLHEDRNKTIEEVNRHQVTDTDLQGWSEQIGKPLENASN